MPPPARSSRLPQPLQPLPLHVAAASLSEVGASISGVETFHLTYVGPPHHPGALAQELESRDVSTSYQPPLETRDLTTALTAVSVVFTATGPITSIAAGVRAFTGRFRCTRVDGLPDQETRLIADRLHELDQLRDSGTITPDEHARQRARTLDEL